MDTYCRVNEIEGTAWEAHGLYILRCWGKFKRTNRGYVMINYSLRLSPVYGLVNLLTEQKLNGGRIRLHDDVKVNGSWNLSIKYVY